MLHGHIRVREPICLPSLEEALMGLALSKLKLISHQAISYRIN